MFSTLRLVVIFALATNLVAADVSGKWMGSMSGNGVVARIYMTFERAGNGISGTLAYKDETRHGPIENPKLSGDQLTFEVHDNPSRVVSFKLTVKEDTMSGDATSRDRVLKIEMARKN